MNTACCASTIKLRCLPSSDHASITFSKDNPIVARSSVPLTALHTSVALFLWPFPLLFIQVITIFAFATVAGFIGQAEFKLNCIGVSKTRQVSVDFYYPFSEMKVYVSKNELCINDTEIKPYTMELKYKSEAEYIVFTGVVSMLFVIVALFYYTFFEDRAKEATSTDVGYFSFPVLVSLIMTLIHFNPFTPQISLVILLTVCHTLLIILVCRIWYWIKW